MRKKPPGRRYRNLTARGGTIYYERVAHGRRHRFSCETDDWGEAARIRDDFETGLDLAAPPSVETTFDDMAEQYLDIGTRGLAATTRDDRNKLLGAGKPIREHFGAMPIDAITRADIQVWWDAAVTARGRSYLTGQNYLDAISAVMNFAAIGAISSPTRSTRSERC